MTAKELVLGVMRTQGKADALELRTRAAGMDGTAVIAEEAKAPQWDGSKDYSLWPAGSPVCYEEQVYKLLQPHNASHYPESTPANTPALWSITHTTDPSMAKPYMAPSGTSGMYMTGECCTLESITYRCLADNTVHSPADLPSAWEEVSDVDG